MKSKNLMTFIRCLFVAAGITLLCLPALLSLELAAYKYFICFGVITASMSVILPEIIRMTAPQKNRGSSGLVEFLYTGSEEKAA